MKYIPLDVSCPVYSDLGAPDGSFIILASNRMKKCTLTLGLFSAHTAYKVLFSLTTKELPAGYIVTFPFSNSSVLAVGFSVHPTNEYPLFSRVPAPGNVISVPAFATVIIVGAEPDVFPLPLNRTTYIFSNVKYNVEFDETSCQPLSVYTCNLRDVP